MTDYVTNLLAELKKIEEGVGDTELVELSNMDVPNGNRIFAKLEYENPSGNLYDRVYTHLLRDQLLSGKIVPGKTHIVQTTSGNAGTAIARIGTKLGFDVTVVLPADIRSREDKQSKTPRASCTLASRKIRSRRRKRT